VSGLRAGVSVRIRDAGGKVWPVSFIIISINPPVHLSLYIEIIGSYLTSGVPMRAGAPVRRLCMGFFVVFSS